MSEYVSIVKIKEWVFNMEIERYVFGEKER
jgi:hypothetical protein